MSRLVGTARPVANNGLIDPSLIEAMKSPDTAVATNACIKLDSAVRDHKTPHEARKEFIAQGGASLLVSLLNNQASNEDLMTAEGHVLALAGIRLARNISSKAGLAQVSLSGPMVEAGAMEPLIRMLVTAATSFCTSDTATTADPSDLEPLREWFHQAVPADPHVDPATREIFPELDIAVIFCNQIALLLRTWALWPPHAMRISDTAAPVCLLTLLVLQAGEVSDMASENTDADQMVRSLMISARELCRHADSARAHFARCPGATARVCALLTGGNMASREVAADFLASTAHLHAVAVKCLLLDAIPSLMAAFSDTSTAIGAFTALVTSATVRSLVWTILANDVQGVERLVGLCTSPASRTAHMACSSVALLLCDDDEADVLMQRGALIALDSYCSRYAASPFAGVRRSRGGVHDLVKYYVLLESPRPEVRAFFSLLVHQAVTQGMYAAAFEPELLKYYLSGQQRSLSMTLDADLPPSLLQARPVQDDAARSEQKKQPAPVRSRKNLSNREPPSPSASADKFAVPGSLTLAKHQVADAAAGADTSLSQDDIKTAAQLRALTRLVIKDIVPVLRMMSVLPQTNAAKLAKLSLAMLGDDHWWSIFDGVVFDACIAVDRGPGSHALKPTPRKPKAGKTSTSISVALDALDIALADLLSDDLDDQDVAGVLLGPVAASTTVGASVRALAKIRGMRKTLDHARQSVAGLVARSRAVSHEGGASSKKQHHKLAAEAADTGSATGIDVFISYSWVDQPRVLDVRGRLAAEGLTSWIDVNAMKPGQQLFEEIDSGITAAKVFVCCLSNAYVSSENCRRELQLAADRRKAIIPVWVAPLESWPPRGVMAPLLAGKLYVNLTDGHLDQSNMESLLAAIDGAMS